MSLNRRSFLGTLAGAVAATPLVKAAEPATAPYTPIVPPAPVAPPGYVATNIHTGARVIVQAESAQEAVAIAARLNFTNGGGTWVVSAETAQKAAEANFGRVIVDGWSFEVWPL